MAAGSLLEADQSQVEHFQGDGVVLPPAELCSVQAFPGRVEAVTTETEATVRAIRRQRRCTAL